MRIPAMLSLLALIVPATGRAAQPEVPITACGDVVPRRTVGYLTGDLQCDAGPGAPLAAVMLSRGATLELRGHTITANLLFGSVVCGEIAGSPPALTITGRCRVDGGGGTITGSTLQGDKMTLSDVTIGGTYSTGIYCDNGCKLENVTLANTGGTAVESRGSVALVDTTITGSSKHGVFTRALRALRSTVTASGGGPECSGSEYPALCADVVTQRRPHLRETSCGTSLKPIAQIPAATWNACASD